MRKLVALGSRGWVLGVLGGWLVMSARVEAAPLSLEDSVRLALKNNLGIEQARRDVKSAEADVTGARSAFLPRLTWSGTYTRPEFPYIDFVQNNIVTFDQSYSSNTSVSLTVFDGLGNLARYRQASRGRSAAEDQFRGAAQGVVYETERRFFEVRRQEALLEVQQEAVRLSDEQLKKTRAMKDLGAATQADVYKADVDHANNRLAALRAERDVDVAKASLATYLGLDPREDVELADEDPDVTAEYDLDAASQAALEVNPSLRAAESSLGSRQAGVRSAKAARYPSLSLSATHSYNDFELSGLDPSQNSAWSYRASVNLTVFDGLLTKSNIRRAEANLIASRRELESTRRDVLFGVRQAYLDLEIARQSIEVAQGAVRSSEEDLRLAQERYKIGEGTILDVIDAQVNLTRSKTDLVTATYDARLAVSALRNAIGDLPVPEVE